MATLLNLFIHLKRWMKGNNNEYTRKLWHKSYDCLKDEGFRERYDSSWGVDNVSR